MTVVFDYQREAQKVKDALREEFGNNTAIQIEEGWHGRLHVKIVSSEFDGKSEDEKQEMIWSVRKARLEEEAQSVALVLAYGLDEV